MKEVTITITGEQGAGKSQLLKIITDAIVQSAYYDDAPVSEDFDKFCRIITTRKE